jgi:tetratricopeptide (TPR) repeat protein
MSVQRIVGWSVAGSVAMILIALAARPKPVDDIEAKVDRVLEIYASGDRVGAQKAADDLLRADPSEPQAWLLLGMLAEDKKDVPAAVRAYESALGLLELKDPLHLDVLVTLADLRRREGDPSGALATIEKLARERGESGRLRHARVLSLIDLRRFEEALSETRLIAEEDFGGGVAEKLEKQIRSLMSVEARDGSSRPVR